VGLSDECKIGLVTRFCRTMDPSHNSRVWEHRRRASQITVIAAALVWKGLLSEHRIDEERQDPHGPLFVEIEMC